MLIFHAKSQLNVYKSGNVLQLKCSYCHGCVCYDAVYPFGLITYCHRAKAQLQLNKYYYYYYYGAVKMNTI
jgi:hypothetical protein